MIRQVLRTMHGMVTLGASVLSPALFLHRTRQEWECLTVDDASAGSFCLLPDGARLHYVQRGTTGRAVVLIHGLMSSTEEWAQNIDALAQAHRVWAIDLIGFGYSSRIVEAKYSLKSMARSVREFLDAEGIARAHVVGHSLGGAVALQLAHDAPGRIDKLVLIDPAAFIFPWLRVVRMAARVPYLPRALVELMLSNPRVHEAALRNALGDPARLDRRALAARLRASQVRGTRQALLAMARSPEIAANPEELDRVAMPALVLWGERDNVLPLEHGRRLAGKLPNARLVVIQDAGHVPNEEFPETVNSLVIDFLNKG